MLATVLAQSLHTFLSFFWVNTHTEDKCCTMGVGVVCTDSCTNALCSYCMQYAICTILL